MPIVTGLQYPENKPGIAHVLEALLTGATSAIKGSQDRAYRRAAAKALGIQESDLGYFQREEIKELMKEKYKNQLIPKEWKPTTKEEAIEIASLKKGASKTFEEELKNKVATGEPLSKEETNYFNKFLKKSMDPELIYNDPNVASAPVTTNKPVGGAGELLKTILGAASQVGNNINPAAGFINMIAPKPGAVTTSVPTAAPEIAAQSGVTAPAADPIAKRIQEAIAQGMDPKEIARQLLEKGIDPATYGL